MPTKRYYQRCQAIVDVPISGSSPWKNRQCPNTADHKVANGLRKPATYLCMVHYYAYKNPHRVLLLRTVRSHPLKPDGVAGAGIQTEKSGSIEAEESSSSASESTGQRES